MVRTVIRHALGFLEGVAGQAIGLVACAGLALALSDSGAANDPAIILAFAVLATPLVIGAAVPVYRHGWVAVAGVAAGWLVVFGAVLRVVVTTNDEALAENLAYVIIAGVILVLPVEAAAVWVAMSTRHQHAAPPTPTPIPDIRELDAKFRPPDRGE